MFQSQPLKKVCTRGIPLLFSPLTLTAQDKLRVLDFNANNYIYVPSKVGNCSNVEVFLYANVLCVCLCVHMRVRVCRLIAFKSIS
jgi:hypothetical protein